MFQKVVVPLDRSTLAERALPAALSLIERSGGELHLVTVVTTSPALAFSGENLDDPGIAAEAATSAAREYLTGIAGRIADAGAAGRVHAHVITGTPTSAIHEWVVKEGADQIVMTTHGRGRIQRLWLGSVADGLVRRTPCPILLWRAGGDEEPELADRPSLGRILVPLDGSDLAEDIMPWAGELARMFDGRLSLLSVVLNPPSVTATEASRVDSGHSTLEVRRKALTGYLDTVKERAGKAGVPAEAEVAEAPTVADAILAHAQQTGSEVIALSTRGHGGAARLVLGSVADKVIRGSDTHVLVHRGDEDAT